MDPGPEPREGGTRNHAGRLSPGAPTPLGCNLEAGGTAMQAQTWSTEYATGHPMVDAQHQRLFGMIHALHGAIMAQRGREEILHRLEQFERTVIEHFAAEDRMMAQHGYPQARRHRDCHRHLMAKAEAIVDDFRTGKLRVTPSLSQFLADWIRQHIEDEDAELIGWVKALRKN